MGCAGYYKHLGAYFEIEAVNTMASGVKVIIDTDLGDDVDDVFALAMAALSDDIDLVAVTTVHGDTEYRACLARMVLDACGADKVPIYEGPTGLNMTGQMVETSMAAGLPCVNPQNVTHGQAVDFLTEYASSNPGEITVCAIGPLTNIGMALERDENFASNVKKLVIMGGQLDPTVDGRVGEYNFDSDVEAAIRVIESGADMLIGLVESTWHARFDQGHREQLNAHRTHLSNLLLQMFDQYVESRNRSWTPLYDPVTLAAMYRPDLVTIEQGGLRAWVQDGKVNIERGDNAAQLVTKVEGLRFVEYMIDVLRLAG